MKTIGEMLQIEVAAYVQTHLFERGIEVVLSGGASVAFYSVNQYVSMDIDLVNMFLVSSKSLQAAMDDLGFSCHLRTGALLRSS